MAVQDSHPQDTTIYAEGSHRDLVTQHEGHSCVARVHYVKWWDKFDINRIISQVQSSSERIPNSETQACNPGKETI